MKLIWLIFTRFGETDPQVEKILSERLVTSFTSATHPVENASSWPVGFSLPILTLQSSPHLSLETSSLGSPCGQ